LKVIGKRRKLMCKSLTQKVVTWENGREASIWGTKTLSKFKTLPARLR